MRLKISRKFKLKETVTLTDPMEGWAWTLRYYSNPEHVEYLKEHNTTGEMMEAFVDLQNKCAMAAGSEGAAKGLRGEAMKQFVAIRGAELYKDKVFDIDIGKLDVAAANPEGLIAHVVENIDGPVDEEAGEVEYSADLGRAIFELSYPIPEDYEVTGGEGDSEFYVPAGTPLGTFYRRWVVFESQNLDNFRESALVEAGKVSAAS